MAAFWKEDLIPRGESVVPAGSLPAWTGFLDGLAEYIKNTIFGVLVLVVIWMFLFIGFRLIIARWQPEKFAEAMKSLVYVIVGLFMVSIAWLAVRLISWLEIN
jgi:hypothetical protein